MISLGRRTVRIYCVTESECDEIGRAIAVTSGFKAKGNILRDPGLRTNLTVTLSLTMIDVRKAKGTDHIAHTYIQYIDYMRCIYNCIPYL